jgi:hypothetical protein
VRIDRPFSSKTLIHRAGTDQGNSWSIDKISQVGGLGKENAGVEEFSFLEKSNSLLVDPVGSSSPLPSIRHRMEMIIYKLFILDML